MAGPTASLVFGVDFSGAVDAGRKIWVARGVIDADTLRIEWVRPAVELDGGGTERERALAALRTFIAEQGACAVGLDFPFGLPAAVTRNEPWAGFVRSFSDRYSSPASMRSACRGAGKGDMKRVADRFAKTPFSPYNLRLYKQTYHGIRDVLAPLVEAGAACALPMQAARPGVPWLLEICPASTLKCAGLSEPYKGPSSGRRAARGRLLDALAGRGVVLPSGARALALQDAEGDALDSIIAAYATAEALRRGLTPREPRDEYTIEGYVYT